MDLWRIRLVVFACLLAVPMARGQQSGVLIGMLAEPGKSQDAQTFEEIKPPVYQTVWVAPDESGKLAVLATIPDVIVPRKDGFWHVGVKQVCDFSPDIGGQGGGNEFMRQEVWSAPVGKPGTVLVGQVCTPHDPSDYAPPYGRSEEDMHKLSQCGYELREFEYVSPVLLSVRKYQGQSEECEARGGRYTVDFSVVNYESDQALKVGEVLGNEAREAYFKALPKQGQGDAGGDCGEPNDRDDGWRIDRHGGRWTLFAHQDLGYFGCNVDAYVPFRLPSSVTGDNAPDPQWKQLKASVKDFRDAYVSPAKDLLMVMTGTELRFCEYVNGLPGKVLLTLPARPILMLQWSTGKHVGDWTKQMKEIEAHPLADAQVQVVASAQ